MRLSSESRAFVEKWHKTLSPHAMANALQCDVSKVYTCINRLKATGKIEPTCTISDIARAASVSRDRVVKIVEMLVARGLVRPRVPGSIHSFSPDEADLIERHARGKVRGRKRVLHK